MPTLLKLTLIVTPKKCAKCLQCEQLVARLQEAFPGRLELAELTTQDEAVEEYGVVLPPMLIVGDFMAAAGNVPRYEALVKLIAAKLPPEGD